MKIKFDIRYRQQIESGKYKVITDNGTPAQIERFDLEGNYPVLAVIKTRVCNYEGDDVWIEDRPYIFTTDGINPRNGQHRRLFIETGDNLSEAERVLYNKINDHVRNRETVDEEEVHEWMEENFIPILSNELKSKPEETK